MDDGGGGGDPNNADNYVLDLYRRRTFNEAFWAGIKVACVGLSLVSTLCILFWYLVRSFLSSSKVGG